MQNFTNENLFNRLTVVVRGTDAATAANFTTFFVADRNYKAITAVEVHKTAGSDGGAVTLGIEQCTGTTAAGSGTVILNGTFNLKGTAETPQYKDFKANGISKGDRLALKLTGTPTALANVTVTVVLQGTN